ncbi:MAG: hypothetical protein ACJ797_22150 [Ktedonobacteraceae bacterium]
MKSIVPPEPVTVFAFVSENGVLYGDLDRAVVEDTETERCS